MTPSSEIKQNGCSSSVSDDISNSGDLGSSSERKQYGCSGSVSVVISSSGDSGSGIGFHHLFAAVGLFVAVVGFSVTVVEFTKVERFRIGVRHAL
ncbi:hypothetical protein ACLB2K_007845 [Fragaria x ananassa]